MLGFTQRLRAVEADSKGWMLGDKTHSDEALQRVRAKETLPKGFKAVAQPSWYSQSVRMSHHHAIQITLTHST